VLNYRLLVIQVLFVCCCFGTEAQIVNIENKRIATDTVGFAGKLGLSLSATKFKESFLSADLHGQVQFKTKKDIYIAILDYQVVNAGGESFNNSAFAHLRYNRKLGSVIRLELFSQLQFNSVTKIDARFLNGVGLRFKLSPYEKAKFYWGIAGMYEYEEVTDPVVIHNDIRLSSYLTFTMRPEENVTFVNTTYVQPLADNFSDYRLANNSKLVFDITSQLKFVTDFNFLYDANPPQEIPVNNYQVKNGLVYKFQK